MSMDTLREWSKLIKGESQLALTNRGYPATNRVRKNQPSACIVLKSRSTSWGAIISWADLVASVDLIGLAGSAIGKSLGFLERNLNWGRFIAGQLGFNTGVAAVVKVEK